MIFLTGKGKSLVEVREFFGVWVDIEIPELRIFFVSGMEVGTT